MTQAHPRPALHLTHCRRLLPVAGALAVVVALSACASKPGLWPSRALPPSAAVTVDTTQFLSRKQLVDWQVDLDERRLRATGSPRHEAYIDALHERLVRTGVKQLRFEPVSFRQWSVQPEDWGLDVVCGDSPGVLPSAGYIPYSGVTPPSGITGRIAYLPPGVRPDASLAGKLVLVEMPKAAWTGQAFRQSAVHVHDPDRVMGPDTPYARPFQRLGPFIALLDSLQAAGAAGVIVILDTPSRTADGLYAPHDGVVRQLPRCVYRPRAWPALAEASHAMLKQVNAAPAFVLPSTGPGPQHAAWPGEATYLRASQRIPTLHYMAQPYYLLDHGIDTTTQLDYRLMQRQIAALTRMLLDLSRVPHADLRKETAP